MTEHAVLTMMLRSRPQRKSWTTKMRCRLALPPMYTGGLPESAIHASYLPAFPVPAAMRRLLHRTLDHQPDPRYAGRQTRGRTLRAIGGRRALPHLRETRAASVLRRPATGA